jgi:hypothetical protein
MRALMMALLLAVAGPALAQGYRGPAVPPLRDRAVAQDALVKARLDSVVPMVMRRAGVDMWIIVAREYAEDPVLRAMLPATWASARRRMVLIFHDRGPEKGVERLAVTRYPVGDLFPSAWNPEAQPDQWARVAELVKARDPKRIAINISASHGLADGLSAGQYNDLQKALGPLAKRLESRDDIALGFLETRTPADMAVYPGIMAVAHGLLTEGLSERVIVPGVTSTQDVVWWYRERLADLRQDAWCQPSVNVQRAAGAGMKEGSQTLPDDVVIQPGDLIHVDFCAGMLGLKTDTQMLAYVLKPGETAAPAGLVAGMAAAGKVQDALVSSFATGRTGNQMLAMARQKAIAQGLEPIIYTHAIGTHGHAAGTSIGLWDAQGGVPGQGDYPLYPNTAFSIELAAVAKVPEWGGQTVRFPLEVDGFWDGSAFRWIAGRQKQLLLIPRGLADGHGPE